MASGNEIYVDVTYISPNVQYFLENVTPGVYHTYYQTTSHTDLSTAEAEFEDVTFNKGGGPGTYNQWNVNSVYVSDYAQGYDLNTLSTLDKFKMGYTNIGVVYMSPSAVGTSGAFHVCPTC
jgi:hypothetical protein